MRLNFLIMFIVVGFAWAGILEGAARNNSSPGLGHLRAKRGGPIIVFAVPIVIGLLIYGAPAVAYITKVFKPTVPEVTQLTDSPADIEKLKSIIEAHPDLAEQVLVELDDLAAYVFPEEDIIADFEDAIRYHGLDEGVPFIVDKKSSQQFFQPL